MKNDHTPRTLAECEFTTGYRDAQLLRRSGAAADIVILLIFIACIAWVFWEAFA